MDALSNNRKMMQTPQSGPKVDETLHQINHDKNITVIFFISVAKG